MSDKKEKRAGGGGYHKSPKKMPIYKKKHSDKKEAHEQEVRSKIKSKRYDWQSYEGEEYYYDERYENY